MLMVRPRGWHLDERHFRWTASRFRRRCSISACTFFTTRRRCCAKAPGLISICRRWRAIWKRGCGTTCFCFAQDELGVPRGTIRATVLIETILAAFEMDEILYELREHSAGLNCGRWDYIFSFIKKFRNASRFRAAGPVAGHDGRAFPEFLCRTADPDLPSARAFMPWAAWRRRFRSRTIRRRTKRRWRRCGRTSCAK